VISAGSGDHTGLRHLRAENAIKGATRFERSCVLQIFKLEKDPGVDLKSAVFQSDAGSAPYVARDAASGILDLNPRDHLDGMTDYRCGHKRFSMLAMKACKEL
jgi:hypothetical protein